MSVLVSIIMPVYNAMPYLEESVRAVQAQTLREWELLLIDDGSVDGSGELADRLAQSDERIRVFHQSNAGVSAARNRGLDEARGKYIGFVDADDLPRAEMFQTLYTAAEENNCAVVTACYHSMRDGKIVFRSKPPFPADVLFAHEDVCGWIPDMHQNRTFLFIWRRLFSAALIRDNALRFDPEISIGEDTLFCLQGFLSADRVIALSDALYVYRYMPDSALRSTRYKPNYYSSLERLHRRKKEIVLQEIPDRRTEYLRDCATYTRRSLMPSILRNFFISDASGFIPFRRLWRGELLRDMLRHLDWTTERSRSLDSIMLRLLRMHLILPAYLLGKAVFGKER